MNVSLQPNGPPIVYLKKPKMATIWVQQSHNNFSKRRCVTRPSWPGHPKRAILGGRGFIHFQRHHGTRMDSWYESHSLFIPSNGELPHRGRTNRPSWQSVSRTPMLSSGARFQTPSQR